MDANNDSYFNLIERVEDAFPEIDSDISTDLFNGNEDYATLRQEIDKLQRTHPIIIELLEGEGAISLSADEHAALVRYMDIKMKIEEAERRHIYFRGHTDNFAYLKKIGAI